MRIFYRFFLFAIIISFSIQMVRAQAPKITRQERKGDFLFNTLSFTPALEAYQKAIRKNKDNHRVKLKIAETHLKLNDTKQAEQLVWTRNEYRCCRTCS